MSEMHDVHFVANILGDKIMKALADSNVMDIYVNSDAKLWIDSKLDGKQCVGEVDLEHIRHAMKVLCQYRGYYLNEDTPSHTVEMPHFSPFDGARCKCIIEPAAPGPSMVIRRNAKTAYPLADFVQKGIVTYEQAEFLRACIRSYRNICVIGIPQSGKTALTSALINEIPKLACSGDRVLVLESTPEIRADIEDVQYLQMNPLSMQDLVKATTQMRPDRIIVGEVTDHSAHDMLKAWNIGCSGGIATFHAKDVNAAPLRLIELCCEKGIEPPIALINTVVDVIVHMVKDAAHPYGRRIQAIAELKSYDYINKVFNVEPIHFGEGLNEIDESSNNNDENNENKANKVNTENDKKQGSKNADESEEYEKHEKHKRNEKSSAECFFYGGV
ncbi:MULTISPECIES: ATPase, T2SS/T4P/T4SS family [Cysteiniphilum]|uniref:Putative conjugal transfer protein TrbB n=1 Tax=Cysteiniphilum litorale TaxID=2056700 RepID=A0A8J2Z510_9GAMM|nr:MULTISPECIES: ATPase, T2SS/T4P/T4SS family [Cysteiniphilum]GGF99102.1 putative conjugal transfer protein TrbB [Cysteiniphilum litorale]